MQTALTAAIRATALGQEADRILRSCVHCGFCNATCPTYQLLGDELDGPRGRIYQIKQLLEGAPVSQATVMHLDRCLTCRNCETTCPSGVEYAGLLAIGREMIDTRHARPLLQRIARWAVRKIIPYRNRFGALLRLGQAVRVVLPAKLQRKIPPYVPAQPWLQITHPRRMLLLQGCAQPVLAPGINRATARVLAHLGIGCEHAPQEVCCGAASHHTSGQTEALDFARRNIDAWWPHVEQGIEAIVSTASGCGVHIKEYAHLLINDPAYATKAQRVAALAKDISEIVSHEGVMKLKLAQTQARNIAFHSPCTLQHGQKINGVVEKLLRELGFNLTMVMEAHLCCGSAGTYSILQPTLSAKLRDRKLVALQTGKPDVIVTANIGCLLHLQTAATTPVRHWIELCSDTLG